MKHNPIFKMLTLSSVCVAILGSLPSGAQTTPQADKVPQGAYQGTLTATTSSAFRLLILENGEVWGMYGRPTSSGLEVAGFVQGLGKFAGGSFTSQNAVDFGTTPPAPFQVQGSYKAGSKVEGSGDSGGYQIQFSGDGVPRNEYNYATAAQLSTVQGAWKMTALGNTNIAMKVAADGHFDARVPAGGCEFSGKMSPRASGKNLFDVQIKFGPAPCTAADKMAKGIAIVQGATKAQQRLTMLGFTTDRQLGAAVQGVR